MFQFTQTYNATTDADTVVCLYPISGQYEVMQRAIYYGLLLFSILAQKQEWLVAGAVASALTYSGTAAIHSIVLAGVSRNSLPDLDILGIWAIANAGCLIMLPAAEFSRQLRESPARPVFKFWGLLMLLGNIMTTVALLRKYPEETICESAEGTLLTSPAQWNPTFNCTYACFSTQQLLRSPADIVVVTKRSLLYKRSNLITAVLWMNYGFTCLGGFLVFFGSGRNKTNEELNNDLRKTKASIDSYKSYSSRNTRGLGELESGLSSDDMVRIYEEQICEIDLQLETGEYKPGPIIGFHGLVSSLLFLVIVIMNEVIIPESNQLGFKEPVYAIGQWSGYVTIMLVLIASGITQLYLPKYNERQQILTREAEERKAKRLDT